MLRSFEGLLEILIRAITSSRKLYRGQTSGWLSTVRNSWIPLKAVKIHSREITLHKSVLIVD
jgi:hypothetical protein